MKMSSKQTKAIVASFYVELIEQQMEEEWGQPVLDDGTPLDENDEEFYKARGLVHEQMLKAVTNVAKQYGSAPEVYWE